MPTSHNEAQINEIAKTVIMPGDPLRAKYIVENYFDNYKLVNQVRGMYAYTGTYKGKELTVMAHGIGMPSIGIYSYELYKFYNVENILRIGSCGAYKPELKLFDIILSNDIYTESNYAYTLNNDHCHIISASKKLNEIISNTSKEKDIKLIEANTVTTDCFDPYMPNLNAFLERIPKDFNPYTSEMEAFALFYNAKLLNKKAACLMSVVDSPYINEKASAEERQTNLNTMIKLALDSAINF